MKDIYEIACDTVNPDGGELNENQENEVRALMDFVASVFKEIRSAQPDNEKVTISIELETLQAVIKELKSSLEPMVPYRIDPLEFCRAAHDMKDGHIQKALSLLPDISDD